MPKRAIKNEILLENFQVKQNLKAVLVVVDFFLLFVLICLSQFAFRSTKCKSFKFLCNQMMIMTTTIYLNFDGFSSSLSGVWGFWFKIII